MREVNSQVQSKMTQEHSEKGIGNNSLSENLTPFPTVPFGDLTCMLSATLSPHSLTRTHPDSSINECQTFNFEAHVDTKSAMRSPTAPLGRFQAMCNDLLPENAREADYLTFLVRHSATGTPPARLTANNARSEENESQHKKVSSTILGEKKQASDTLNAETTAPTAQNKPGTAQKYGAKNEGPKPKKRKTLKRKTTLPASILADVSPPPRSYAHVPGSPMKCLGESP